LRWVLGIGAVLMLVKFLAWLLTDSTAILTDALESIVNVIAAGFALRSLQLALLPRDENHPYGHGKIEFFSAGLEGLLILAAAVGIIIKALRDLWAPEPLGELALGTGLVLAAGIVNGFLGFWLLRKGRETGSLILKADGQHLLTDLWSSIGLVAGLVALQLTGYRWLDPVVALVMAGVIGRTGIQLVLQAYSGLMDETDYGEVERVVQAVAGARREAWVDVHNLRVQRYGSHRHLDAHITLPHYYTLNQVHSEVNAFEDICRQVLGAETEVFLHTDPCRPMGCSHCRMAQCAVRSEPYKQDYPWVLNTVMPNRQHGGNFSQT
jgi:cation diffusion facilitator family transporter